MAARLSFAERRSKGRTSEPEASADKKNAWGLGSFGQLGGSGMGASHWVLVNYLVDVVVFSHFKNQGLKIKAQATNRITGLVVQGSVSHFKSPIRTTDSGLVT